MMYLWVFRITGVFALALGVLLLVAPHVYLSLYVPLYDPINMPFAAQRLSPAIIGLGALLLLASSLPQGAFAARFAMLAALVWFGVAGTGVFHYLTGTATWNILVAAGTEVILGVLFLTAARSHRTP
ncbi:hypothetical protein [Pseudooctadecabacter jejudonensis]|uniref:DUF4345 domain-containing protein n=1 Tax=Pseudooctadecabacter jejudonensis TaxID=1391910 RepID=A0A1Y5RCS4_9RHOB|nr:hypothetical protein [Pseudooctadecabacter jejudonensis]SLN14445.1 hypothetical protein PSJ8397_00266 [Pseudooctadecabacter jejudonensis]